MMAVTAGDKNMDFVPPQGITFTEVDETSGGLVTPYCPRNVIVREAFKAGTEPTHPCPTHSSTVIPTVPMYDEFGNLITMTSTDPTMSDPTMTDTGGFRVPPDSTLTGGVFRPPPTTTTTPPPPLPTPPPVTTTTAEEEEEEEEPPPPPPPTDTSTTTGGPLTGVR